MSKIAVIDGVEYVPLQGTVFPGYSYTEGDKAEDYYVDFQNCLYYYFEDESDTLPAGYTHEGKKHYVIQYYHRRDTPITADNVDDENLYRYIVVFGPKESMYREWDWDNHCPKSTEVEFKEEK